jgi:hypothetical protein
VSRRGIRGTRREHPPTRGCACLGGRAVEPPRSSCRSRRRSGRARGGHDLPAPGNQRRPLPGHVRAGTGQHRVALAGQRRRHRSGGAPGRPAATQNARRGGGRNRKRRRSTPRRPAHGREPGWVRWIEVRAAVEVASLQVNDRQVPVHDHGVAVVVWGTELPPHIAALGADGSRLGPVQLRYFPGY